MRSFAFRLLPIAALSIMGILSATALGQNYPGMGMTSIHGSVRDAVTHRPLERVILMVDGEASGNVQQVETDSMGKFSVQGLGAAVYVVRVHFHGYQDASERLDLSVASSNFLDFELHPLPGIKAASPVPEAPPSKLNVRLASVPDKARKEFLKANDLWQQGKDPQACIEHLNRAIKEYPKFADAYLLLANVQMRLNNSSGANTALDQAIAIDPNFADAWFTRGMLQNRQRDFIASEESFKRGLELDDSSAEGHYELARTYWALGRWQESDPHAQKAASLMPSMAPVHVVLGNIALRKQDAAGALKEFQEYLKLDPNGPMAAGAQAMVKKIQDAIAADAAEAQGAVAPSSPKPKDK